VDQPAPATRAADPSARARALVRPAHARLKVTRPLYLEGPSRRELLPDIRDRLLEELELRTAHDARNVEVAQKIAR
jgi:hypothetical protein